MDEGSVMSEYLTPQELVDRITASGYDGYWSMTVLAGDGLASIWLAPDTKEQLAAALLAAPEGIERQMKVTDTGVVFCSTNQWRVRICEMDLP